MTTSLFSQPTLKVAAPQPPRLLDQVAQGRPPTWGIGTDDGAAGGLGTGLRPVSQQAAPA